MHVGLMKRVVITEVVLLQHLLGSNCCSTLRRLWDVAVDRAEDVDETVPLSSREIKR